MDVGADPSISTRGPDPFNATKAVVERVLHHVQCLQSDAFAGDTPAARRLPAALTSLEDQLAALEAAVDQMARAPGKFGLDGDIIAGRREQVEGLRLEAAEVARICEGMGVRAGGSSGGGGGGGGWDEGGDDIAGGFQDVDLSGERRRGPDAAKASRYYPDHLGHATPPTQSSPPPYSFNTRTASARGGTGGSAGGGVPRASGGIGGRGDDLEECVQEQLQRHAMWEQDEMLGDIEMQVGRIKHMGVQMNEELEQQGLLLGDLDGQVEASTLRMRGLRKRTRQLIEETRKDRQLQLIAVMCVVLAVLVVTAFI